MSSSLFEIRGFDGRRFRSSACDTTGIGRRSAIAAGRERGGCAGRAVPRGPDALYRRLGGTEGIRTVMTDFVGRAVADPKINGYFLNARVSGARITECLVLQVGAMTGGPLTYPSMGCRDMSTVHKDMGISKADFDDTANHLVAAMTRQPGLAGGHQHHRGRRGAGRRRTSSRIPETTAPSTSGWGASRPSRRSWWPSCATCSTIRASTDSSAGSTPSACAPA